MKDNIVSGNKFAFGNPLSASSGINWNLTVQMPESFSLTGKWAVFTVSKFEDGPVLFKLTEGASGFAFNGQNIPVVVNASSTNEISGGDDWDTLLDTYRNLRFALDVGDNSDTATAQYRFQGNIITDPRRGSLTSGVEVGETITPTIGGNSISVSLLGAGTDGINGVDGADGADGADAAVNQGSASDIDGVVIGDGSNLDAATAEEIRAAAELDTTDGPTFASLDLSGDITLSDGASIDVGGGTGTLNVDGKIILKHNGGIGIDVENSNGNYYDRVSYIGSSEASKNYLYSGISHNVVYLAGGYAFRWRVQNTDALKIEYGGHVTVEQDLEAKGDVDFSGIPTSDPAVAGRVWNDSGTLKISAG